MEFKADESDCRRGQVLTYSLARPAREVLFTVVSREEKYKAKIFIDTVVQRTGDAIAAGMFQTLAPWLGFGPSGAHAANFSCTVDRIWSHF